MLTINSNEKKTFTQSGHKILLFKKTTNKICFMAFETIAYSYEHNNSFILLQIKYYPLKRP